MTTTNGVALAMFDFDGTLVNSQHAIVSAMSDAWRDHGRAPPAPEDVRRVVGLPLVEAVGRLLPEGGHDDHVRLADSYKSAWQAARAGQEPDEPLYPGVVAALDELAAAGLLLGIATGKGRRGLLGALDHHGLTQRFVTLKTSDDGPGKPDPHMLHQAMAEVGADAAATVMIGDTTFDMDMAKAAGVAAIGVGWGYHELEELRDCGAAATVESFAEIPGTVRALLGG